MLVFLACSGTVPNEVQQELDRLNAELNRTKKVAKDAIKKLNHLQKKISASISKTFLDIFWSCKMEIAFLLDNKSPFLPKVTIFSTNLLSSLAFAKVVVICSCFIRALDILSLIHI